jgi:GMP synthase-like glutamine amidotransferase
MSVLILKNISSEGPGTISRFLDDRKIPFTVVDLCAGERIPDSGAFDALVLMGGPMSVNDDTTIPYLNDEFALTRQFIAAGKRVFGVCLGAQIMAKALGAHVYPGQEKEIGWYDIAFTADGSADCAMQALARSADSGAETIKVFQWHGETFDLPAGAVHLASSPLYRHQAFRYGAKAYAFQFHIEVTEKMVYDWLKNEPIDQCALKTDTEKLYHAYYERAYAFYTAFFSC